MDSSIQIEEIAARWVARRDRGDWSPLDENEFTEWLHASLAHRVAFVRLNAMWKEANRLKALGAGIDSGAVPAPGEWRASPFFDGAVTPGRSIVAVVSADSRPSLDEPTLTVAAAANNTQSAPVPKSIPAESQSVASESAAVQVVLPVPAGGRRRWSTQVSAIAASVVLCVVGGGGWFLWSSKDAYQTSIGSTQTVPIADGSRVTLNTNSKVRIAVTDTERRVVLSRGEAFFEVAKDPHRPFVVVAGEQKVIAVGTKFSVRRSEGDSDELQVFVTEGRVRVEPMLDTKRLPPVEVDAGSIARSDGGGVMLDAQPPRPVEEYLTWRSGFLMFRATPIAEAIAEFNRYSATKIVIEDPSVATIHIGGNFRSDNVDAFVRLVERSFSVRAERRGNQIVLIAN